METCEISQLYDLDYTIARETCSRVRSIPGRFFRISGPLF